MPYFINNNNEECQGYAVEKENGEVIGCHNNLQEAIDQMVALSLAEDIEPGGERSKDIKQYAPPQGARDEAKRGLEWRREFGRGGTEVGVARARDISNGRNLSEDTIIRMVSYFARHEVDKRAEGFRPGEDGYPSNGRIAWALWGGDPGKTWAERILAGIEREREKNTNIYKENIQMRIKSFPINTIEVKLAKTKEAPYGEFTAIVSVFNNIDLVGDKIRPGAFAKSLLKYKEKGINLPIVWSHDWGNAESFIGKTLSAEETEEGLKIRGAFFDTPRAQIVRTLLSEKVVSEFSFAYDTIEEEKNEEGYNELIELHILEAGPTLKGANPATQLIEAKNIIPKIKAEPGELEEGSFVEFEDGYGRVEYIMTEGTFGVEGDELSLIATSEDPLALVRLYTENENEYIPTDLFKGFRFSELELVTEEETIENTEEVENTESEDTNSKMKLATQAKTEEPAQAKVEEQGLDPDIARALIEFIDVELN